MSSKPFDMYLMPSLSYFQVFLATIPLVAALGPSIMKALLALYENPLVRTILNTSSVVLKTTEVVWRPSFDYVVKALTRFLPIVKTTLVSLVNFTVTAFRTAQSMGLSMSNAFPAFAQSIKEIAESLLVLARGLGQLSYYLLRAVSLVVGSVDSVLEFGKRLFFETHRVTAADVYDVLMPFGIVLGLLYMTYSLRKTPPASQICVSPKEEPRRSSRLARKRSMLCSSDLSEALPPCKKSSATASNL
jgi:hypothetical protein